MVGNNFDDRNITEYWGIIQTPMAQTGEPHGHQFISIQIGKLRGLTRMYRASNIENDRTNSIKAFFNLCDTNKTKEKQ